MTMQSTEAALTTARFIGDRIGKAMVGAIGATCWTFCDWLLPVSLKLIYLVFDHVYYRAKSMDRLCKLEHVSLTKRCMVFALWVAYGVAFLTFIPSQNYILLYMGINGYALLGSFAWLNCWMTDYDATAYNNWLAYRDSSVMYLLYAYGWANWRWVLSLIYRTTIVAVPLVVVIAIPVWMFSLGLPLAGYLLQAARTISEWVITPWLQFYTIVCAILTEHLPTETQHTWSRYQQSRKPREKMPMYQHKPLNAGDVRLLVLHRATFLFPSTIHASLLHSPTYCAPDQPDSNYDALSYRWGSSELTDEIIVDGCRYPVTRAAIDLLIAQRSVWRDKTVWIDAICINQDDNEEKTKQIHMMQDIYHRASRVVVFPSGGWRSRLAWMELMDRHAIAAFLDSEEYHRRPPTATMQWHAMVHLCTEQYFNRAWIVQEIAAGRQVDIYCGGYYIPWVVFFGVIERLFNSPTRSSLMMVSTKSGMSKWQTFTTFENIAVLETMRKDSEMSRLLSKQGLDGIIFATNKFRTTDPRDKVFSLLGITGADEGNALLKVDYTKSTHDVLRDFARYCLLAQKVAAVQILALAGIGYTPSRMPLPSWVPDLSEERSNYPLTNPFFIEGDTKGCFSAASLTEGVVRPGLTPDSIEIGGIIVDKLHVLSKNGPLHFGVKAGDIVSDRHMGYCKMAFAESAAELAAEYCDSETVQNSLWQTLVVDRTNMRCPAPLKFKIAYRHWSRYVRLISDAPEDAPPSLSVLNEEELASIIDDSMRLFDQSLLEGCNERCFGVSVKGTMCIVPPLSLPGDVLFVPFGAQAPVLIRQVSEGVFRLVGEVYAQGLMYGAAFAGEEAADPLMVTII